jgi:hypothetical protein
MPGELIPLVAIAGAFAIPIVALLIGHQRKMAELIHGAHSREAIGEPLLAELRALRSEVAQLRDMVNTNIVRSDLPQVSRPEDLRLNQ